MSTDTNRLGEFFVLTTTSVYRVADQLADDGEIIVEKIALRGRSAVTNGNRLTGGQKVVITKRLLYVVPDGYDPDDGPSILLFSNRTSKICALFLDRQRALDCFQAFPDAQPWDPRLANSTELTLNQIGDRHPRFRLFLGDLSRKK